jgi:hypothetical protein
MTNIRFITGLLGAAVLAGCSKESLLPLGGPLAGSNIKFYNLAINAPGVNFFANDTKVTAISTSNCTPPTDPKCTTTGLESTNGTNYGAVGNAGIYSSIAPGQYTFTGRIAAATNNGFPVSTVASALTDGKSYSYYQSGFYNATTKTSEAFIVEDAYPAQIDLTISSARFVNASSNSSPMTLYAKNTVTGDSVVLGSNVAYKGASAFVSIPPAFYDLTARVAGSNAAVISRAGVSFSGGRVYTVSAFGDITVTSATAATRPQLDNTPNR